MKLLFSLFILFLPLAVAYADAPTAPISNNPVLEENLSEYKDAAAAGNAAAAQQLFLRYQASQEQKAAEYWRKQYQTLLQKQADQGNTDSLLRLAANYLSGKDGFSIDREQALLTFSKASAKGDASAAYILGELFKEDKKADIAEEHYKLAFERYSNTLTSQPDDAKSLYWAGTMLVQGLGTKPNQALGLQYLEKAAELKLPWAYTQLFKMYAQGEGVDKDESKAIFYAKKMADDLADPVMAYTVACAYYNGQGVAADEAIADQYLDRAVQANVGDAITLKASRLEQKGQLSEAAPLYRQAASMGQKEALTRYGLMLLRGEGLEKDESEALACLTTAANRMGSPQACLELAYYYDSIHEAALADDWYIAASDLGIAQAMARRGLQHLNPQSKLDWNPTLTYRWWKAGKSAGDPTCSLYINLFTYLFIPLLLILCLLGPLFFIKMTNRPKKNKNIL